MPTVLHVGCGANPLPAWLADCTEVRLDIDPSVEPDICADMTDMGQMGHYDSIYCSHALEHLYPHDAIKALGEFKRVLKPGGHAVIIVPDLEGVKATEDVLFDSPGGPICGRDLIYGKADLVEQSEFMAHKSGYVCETLGKTLVDAGFVAWEVRRMDGYNLFAVAVNV